MTIIFGDEFDQSSSETGSTAAQLALLTSLLPLNLSSSVEPPLLCASPADFRVASLLTAVHLLLSSRLDTRESRESFRWPAAVWDESTLLHVPSRLPITRQQAARLTHCRSLTPTFFLPGRHTPVRPPTHQHGPLWTSQQGVVEGVHSSGTYSMAKDAGCCH